MPGPKGGNKDAVDALNGIFDARDNVTKASDLKKRYNLTEEEFLELQDSLLQETRGAFQKAADDAASWGIEILTGAKPVKRRSSDEIIETAKRRMK